MTNTDPYRSVRELCREIYQYDPPSVTVRRWASASNKAGHKLSIVKLGGEFRCRRSDLVAFIAAMSDPLPRAGRPDKVRKSRSKAATAASLSRAEQDLAKDGIV